MEPDYAELLRRLRAGEANAVIWTHLGEGDHVDSPDCWCRPTPEVITAAEGV